MTHKNDGAKGTGSSFDDDYKAAAQELVSFINSLDSAPRWGGISLGGLFRKKAPKQPPQEKEYFNFDPNGPEEYSADHAKSAATHHLEGIRNVIRNDLMEGRSMKEIIASIDDRRNPLLVYGGPLPKRPDGLFVIPSRSPEAANNGRLALWEDVQSLIRIAEVCEKDFEKQRRQGPYYHTEHGYGRVSYLQWLNTYIENRKSGKTHDASLPVAIKSMSYRKVGKPAKTPNPKP